MLQLRRPFKSLTTNWCILCMGNVGMIDHLFLHCPINSGLWHNLFKQARLDWVQPKSIHNMMTISYRDLGSSIKGKIHPIKKKSKARSFGKWLVSLYFESCGMKEILGSLRISGECQRYCEIYFTSIPLLEPLVPTTLKAFLSISFNSIGIQCVDQKGWISNAELSSGLRKWSL